MHGLPSLAGQSLKVAKLQLFMITIKALKASMKELDRILYALALVCVLGLSACSSTDDEPAQYDTSTITDGLAVRGFTLRADAKVLNNLDSVFFSIDLNTARIFNADSLPYGTDISALAVNITSDACSALTLHYTDENGEEKTVDYIENDDTEIDFSHGAVRLHMVSQSGENKRDYLINVNVHTVVPDSLFWSDMARTNLTTKFSRPVAQKTVAKGGTAYCLSTDGSAWCLGVNDNLFDAQNWTTKSVTFPAKVRIETLAATTEALFILTESGSLLTSTDGSSWTSTGESWSSIIAPYGTRLLGVKASASGYNHVSYPAAGVATAAVPADFPISGFSGAAQLTTKWADAPQIMILGGKCANGNLSGATWAYDGTSWAKLGSSMTPAEGYAMARYTISETDTVSWRLKEREVLLAFGGKNAEGINRNVYISRDMGLTWKKGDVYLQLPEYMPEVYGADLLVFGTMMSADAAAGTKAATAWLETPLAKLPSVYTRPTSRAISSIETWECPFLYMFGGTLDDGTLQNAVWRGVVNHFTFRPLE